MKLLSASLVLLSSHALWAGAPQFSIAPIADQKVELGAVTPIAIQVSTDSDQSEQVALSLDVSALTALDAGHDVATRIEPASVTVSKDHPATASLIVTTRTSAPSVGPVSIAVTGRSQDGPVRVGMNLSVIPVYTVDVIPNSTMDPTKPFDFSSPDEVAYFRPHKNPGLTIRFHNLSTQTFYIHGDGAIEHQDLSKDPTPPGEYYTNAIIKDDMPDFKGSYTIHGIYYPNRDVVVNATTIH